MKLNLYEINEFNKEFKNLNDSLNNEDNKKILEYAQKRKQELNDELKEIQIHQIENDGNLTAEEWLKKDFLEKEIVKHEDTISKINTEREATNKKILEKRLQKEEIKRQLNLEEAQVEIELANIQKKWNEAISEMNNNKEKIKQLRLNNRELPEESEEVQNNLNEILRLQNENEKLKLIMQENVITSKKGMEINKKLEETKAMKNILESGAILEGVKNPNEKEIKSELKEQESTKQETPEQDIPKEETQKTETTKPAATKTDTTKTDATKTDTIKTDAIKPAATKPTATKPASKDTIEVKIDASTGLAVLTRKISGKEYRVNRDLEKIFDKKEEKEIRNKIIEQLMEKDEVEYAKDVKKLRRKLNPAVLDLISDEKPELIKKYIDAVREGDKDILPFDKYDIKLDDGVYITEKPFTRLNRYALRDNKNLGTDFKATPWYTLKKTLNKVLPKKLPFVKKMTEALPKPVKESDLEAITKYSKAKDKRKAIIEGLDKQYLSSQKDLEKAKTEENEAKKALKKATTIPDKKKAEVELEIARKERITARDDEVKNNRGPATTSKGLREALKVNVPPLAAKGTTPKTSHPRGEHTK